MAARKIKLSDGTIVFNPNKDIEEELYNAYSQKFQTGKVGKTSWIAKFVDKNMDALEKNLDINPDSAASTLREINRVVSSTQEFYNKRNQLDADLSEYMLRKRLFPWQQKVYDETRQRIKMLCGRRSGKSFTVIELALRECLKPPIGKDRPRCAIILGLGKEKTAQIYWDNIRKAIDECHIKTNHIDNGSYTITFANGNILRLLGNGNKKEREEIRGKDFSFIAIDEMQSQQGLYYLFESIIKPIIKGTNGTIVCLGTAPLSAGTIWEEIINDDKYVGFHATMEDNPSTPNFEHALEEVLEENHWTRDNITFRREYLAEIAYDTNRMVYPNRTYYEELPKDFKPVKAYIGVDYGWRDYSSFAPILIDAHGECYLWDEWKQNKTAASQTVEVAKTINEKIHKQFNIPMEDIQFVADTSHQQISIDMLNQGVTNIRNAYKQDEKYQIARVAEALEVGYLHIKKNGYFDQECDMLVWKWNEEKGCVIYELDDSVYHGDISDSVKYAYNQYLSERNAYGV